MQKPISYGLYSERGGEAAIGIELPALPPPPDQVSVLFETAAPAMPPPAEASSSLQCDAPPVAALADAAMPAGEALGAHSGGCGCLACALPGLEGLPDAPLGAENGPRSAEAGPLGTVIEASVDQSVIVAGGAGIAYADTFKLHSLPGAKYTVYLDFDGHTTTGTAWNSYWGTPTFYSSAFATDSTESFNATELLRIQQIWIRMAEYFSPFNINVTTQDPGAAALSYSGTTDTNGHGIRVVITDEGGKNFGGIAYRGSFTWSSDTPVYVYANRLADSAKSIADAAAHEVGHSLGLNHDGRGTSEYYYGHGSGATDWAPVLGVGYNANIVQWSNGGYNGATNTEDDLGIITSRNQGVTYRADDHGNTFTTASALGGSVAGSVATVKAYGIISGSGARNDVDMFKFVLGAGGAIDLTVSGYTRVHVAGSTTPVETASPFSMLDVGLVLYDASFRQVSAWNETARIDGALKLAGLEAGTYYLALDGVGWGAPDATTPTGYSDYGSLGQYMIKGTYSADGSTGAGGTGDTPTTDTTGGGTTTGSGGTTAPPTLAVSRTAITMTEGGTETFTVSALGATADVIVQLSGIVAGEVSLSASQVLLNAANGWSAAVSLTSLHDRDVGGNIAYTLNVDSGDLAGLDIAVTSRENDISAASSGRASGTYSTAVGLGNSTVKAQATDDNVLTNIREGVFSNGQAGVEMRWEFRSLGVGDRLVQVDARSTTETFRFEFSVDGAKTWRTFDGAPASSLEWNGSYLATGIATNLWVRLVDDVRTGDTVRDLITLDLLTLGTPVAAATADLVFG